MAFSPPRFGIAAPSKGLVGASSETAAQDATNSVFARQVYDRYAPYVAAVAMKLMGRDGDVEDVVQDVFVSALPGLASVRDREAIKGWLSTITVRLCTLKLRRRRLMRWLRLDRFEEPPALVDPSLNGEERATLANVYRELDCMPTSDRVAWVLRHIEDHSALEVAQLCGCSLATAKRRISRADALVRKVIADD